MSDPPRPRRVRPESTQMVAADRTAGRPRPRVRDPAVRQSVHVSGLHDRQRSGRHPSATDRTGPRRSITSPPRRTSRAPPEPPKAPRWLWLLAGLAVLLVLGLVVALVIVNGLEQQTVVAPPADARAQLHHGTEHPPLTPRTPTGPPRRPRCRCRSTPPGGAPSPTHHHRPGATETVVYSVTGRRTRHQHHLRRHRRRAADGVQRRCCRGARRSAGPARGHASASVSIVNVGRDITCSITRRRRPGRQRTGLGLTICAAAG